MATSIAEKKLTFEPKKVIHYIIMLLIMAAFHFIPAFGTITPYGMKLLGVFIGLIYGWTFIGMLAPSLIGCFGLGFAGFGNLESVTLALFNNINVLLMIIGSIGFDALRQTNASDWLFAKILTSKMAKKSSVFMVGSIFALILLLGALGMGILLNFVIFPIMNEFLKKCGYQKGDTFCTLFLIGYMIAAIMPIGILPFYSWGLMICGSLQSISLYTIPLAPYILANLIIYALFIITYPLLMKLVGCDFSKLQNVNVVEAFDVKPETKLNIAQKFALFGILIFIAVVIICSFAPIPFLQAAFGRFTVSGLMLLYWVIMVVVKVDGKPILDMSKAAGFMSWDLLILIAVALVLSSALTSPESGISSFIAMAIGPVFAKTGQITFLIALSLILIVLTNLANNIAVVFIVINIVASLYLNGLPINLLATSIVLAIGSCAVAYLTPASSMPGAILHGGAMTVTKDIYFWNCVMMIYEFVLLMVVCIPIVILGIGM